jgi:hypothetical protein
MAAKVPLISPRVQTSSHAPGPFRDETVGEDKDGSTFVPVKIAKISYWIIMALVWET